MQQKKDIITGYFEIINVRPVITSSFIALSVTSSQQHNVGPLTLSDKHSFGLQCGAELSKAGAALQSQGGQLNGKGPAFL